MVMTKSNLVNQHNQYIMLPIMTFFATSIPIALWYCDCSQTRPDLGAEILNSLFRLNVIYHHSI